MNRPSPLSYLMRELNGKADFTLEWKRLSDEDKETLKKWATEEMDVLNVQN